MSQIQISNSEYENYVKSFCKMCKPDQFCLRHQIVNDILTGEIKEVEERNIQSGDEWYGYIFVTIENEDNLGKYYRDLYVGRNAVTALVDSIAFIYRDHGTPSSYHFIMQKLLSDTRFREIYESTYLRSEIRIYRAKGTLHGFYVEVGRISRTSGPHYDVNIDRERNRVIICDDKDRCADIHLIGSNLIINLPDGSEMEWTNYFAEKFQEVKFYGPDKKEYDLIAIQGLGVREPEEIAKEIIYAIGKYTIYTMGDP